MDNNAEKSTKNTILVLTELDKSAKIAAEYALTLAMELDTNLLLFNSHMTQESPYEQQPRHTDIPAKTIEQLENEVKRLQSILKSNQPSLSLEIHYMNEEGEMADTIFNVLKKENVIMIVKGGQFEHDEDDLLGIEFIKILRKVRLPILIVPEYSSVINRE